MREQHKQEKPGLKAMTLGSRRGGPTFVCENCKKKRYNPCGCQRKKKREEEPAEA